MTSRLGNLRGVDPIATSLAIGYSNAEYISELLFPMAQVKKLAGKIPKHNKQAFKLVNSRRAIRAHSNVLKPENRAFIDFSLNEHDLAVPLDYLEKNESDDLDVVAAHAILAQEGIMLRREYTAAQLAFDPANYAATNKLALDAASKFSNPTSDPFAIVKTGRQAVRSVIGREPNVMALGAKAFDDLCEHPKVLERLTYAQLGIVTEELLAKLFKFDKVVVGRSILVSDDDVTTTDIWGDCCLLAYVRPPQPGNVKRSVYEPNYGYTIYMDVPASGKAVAVDKYDAEGGKVEYQRNTMIYQVQLVGADAGYLLSNVR